MNFYGISFITVRRTISDTTNQVTCYTGLPGRSSQIRRRKQLAFRPEGFRSGIRLSDPKGADPVDAQRSALERHLPQRRRRLQDDGPVGQHSGSSAQPSAVGRVVVQWSAGRRASGGQ